MAEDSLAPSLLLAMPQLADPDFSRTVVLLCRQEEAGSMGLVVNRNSQTPVSAVVDFEPPPSGDNGVLIWHGGPVDPERGWLLLGYDPGEPDALQVDDNLYLSSSMDVLRGLVQNDDKESGDGRFLLGHAGWGVGQLESEIAASAWLTTDVSHELLFHTPADKMWEAAIRTLGIDPFSLQSSSGVH